MTTPKKKNSVKKRSTVEPTPKEILSKKIKNVEKKLVTKFKKAKKGFDLMDSKRKKEILAGIICAGAVAVGIGASIASKKKVK